MELIQMAICIAVLLIAPFLLGNLFLKKTISGTYISGVLLWFGIFELISVAAVKKAWDFQTLSKRFFIVFCILGCLGAVCFFIRVVKKQWTLKGMLSVYKEILWLIPAFCLVAVVFFVYVPKLESWYLVPETVTTILDTNSLHGYNPLTGQPLTAAKSMRDSLINLPAFYACLIDWFQIRQGILLFKIIPVWVLFVSFLVFYQLAAFFFKELKVERIVFMWVYALVLFCGDRAYMNESYQLLHYAYEGRAILTAVLLPYCFYLIASFFTKESNGLKVTMAVKYAIEYMFILICGVLVTGIDYGIGLPCAMTIIGFVTGCVWLLSGKIRKCRRKA